MKKGLHNLIKGERGNNIAINWFLGNGFTVYKPAVDIEKIDFIARKTFGGKSIKPHYFEIQVKSNTEPAFYVPRREYGWSNENYFYVFVQLPNKGEPRIYFMTQTEIKKLRYKSTRLLNWKKTKQFEKGTVVIRLSKEDQKIYDINKRKDLLKRRNV
mgnify:CR=1 FL=1